MRPTPSLPDAVAALITAVPAVIGSPTVAAPTVTAMPVSLMDQGR
jgi:hypothetical protein